MRSHTFLRAGLLLILLALLLPAFDHAMHLATNDQLTTWKGHLFTVAMIAFALALVLAIFEKAGMKVAGARCKDCKKRIPHGHAFCFDHLMARQTVARERAHGRRGAGI